MDILFKWQSEFVLKVKHKFIVFGWRTLQVALTSSEAFYNIYFVYTRSMPNTT